MNMQHWILDDDWNPVPVDDLMVWAQWFETAERHLAHDSDEGDDGTPIRISTVFLGIDHRFDLGYGPPVLWETLVFGGSLDGEMHRYASKEEALLGHRQMCERVHKSGRVTRAATEPS